MSDSQHDIERAPKEQESGPQVPASAPAKWGWVKDNLKLVAIALVISVVVRLLIAEPRYIPSNSMDPTLHIGDRLLVEKVSYRLHPPTPGDVVVFAPPPQLQAVGFRRDQAFIKRVIALPGQIVAVVNGQVLVDNVPQQEPYILEPPAYTMRPYTVPAGQLFVMGDNRNDSNDSHVWGALPQQNLIGRAVFRFWPLEAVGTVTAPSSGPPINTTQPAVISPGQA